MTTFNCFKNPLSHRTIILSSGLLSALLGTMLLPQSAFASGESIWAKTPCTSQFYNNAPPFLVKESLRKNTTPLCLNGFNVMYSGVSKTPFWSAEHLTPVRLSQKIKRQDSFHEEDRVSPIYRATLKDYRGSGYDRGHMSPNGDMPDEASQYDSFSLANMVPQAPKNNQEIWRMLEEATRGMVTKQKQDVYVVTGPIFAGKKLQTIGNGVFVPSAVFKAVYYPKTGVIGAYYAPNDDSLQVNVVSVCQIEALTGINLFPSLSEATKRKVYDLPESTADIKANRAPAYLSTDTKSDCAAEVSAEELTALKKQFTAPNRPSEGSTSTSTGNSQNTWVSFFKRILMDLLEFFLKMMAK
ncbi:DNA/RNA non-specific endonuclease [Acinetobacter rathckeae]|uniref:DNA/RNA non-specific endonuclease n=1 Tax=Acinetobacter rathckeae TaxID=2605272 RepID=UPI0018A312F6|nr:DNA/RNA non-specific endonuclease [Acinetobacter rathckeae]MBF7696258.1 DNA/RNA non-specific endonuclease [Acinetobacter rathckeae]